MLASFKKQRAAAEVAKRRNLAETYTEPLNVTGDQALAEFREFLAHFYKNVYYRRQEMNAELAEYPKSLGKHYQLLVPSKVVTMEDFWQRYYWRCSEERVIKEWDRADQEAREARASFISNRLADVQHFVDDVSKSFSTPKEKQADTVEREIPPEEPEEVAIVFESDVVEPEVVEDKTVDQDSKEPPKQDTDIVESKPKEEQKQNAGEPSHQPPPARPSSTPTKRSVTPDSKERESPMKSPPAAAVESMEPKSPPKTSLAANKVDSPVARDGRTPTPTKRAEAPVLREWKTSTPMEKEEVASVDDKVQSDRSPVNDNKNEASTSVRTIIAACIALLAVGAAVLVAPSPVVAGYLCAPVKPGTQLLEGPHDLSYDAPWWAPDSYESSAFFMCGNRARTRIKWMSKGKRQNYRLSIISLNDKDEEGEVILDKERLSSATIYSNYLTVVERKHDTTNDLDAPWV